MALVFHHLRHKRKLRLPDHPDWVNLPREALGLSGPPAQHERAGKDDMNCHCTSPLHSSYTQNMKDIMLTDTASHRVTIVTRCRINPAAVASFLVSCEIHMLGSKAMMTIPKRCDGKVQFSLLSNQFSQTYHSKYPQSDASQFFRHGNHHWLTFESDVTSVSYVFRRYA
jgi:hypothetical protein